MKKNLMVLAIMTFLLSTTVSPALAANKPPQKGEGLPAINLPVPKNPDEKTYLGLSGSGFFKIPQIKASAVIVEIFSMYCPYCQKDAPGINELYRLIENNTDLKNKIKIIGIGAGNSSYEVEVFRKNYNVPFPLFPDKDFTIHKACGEVRTPYFMVVKINEDGSHQIVHAQLGEYPGAEPFLELVLKASGLK
jgi:peroxiredoxin